jgi:mRNA interferase HigB
MHIIAVKTLREFWENPDYHDAEQPLKAWYREAKHATWKTPADIKAKYGNASIIGNNRVVFNIAGNKYRLVIKFHYNRGVGYVRFIGTHKAYDKIDAEAI